LQRRRWPLLPLGLIVLRRPRRSQGEGGAAGDASRGCEGDDGDHATMAMPRFDWIAGRTTMGLRRRAVLASAIAAFAGGSLARTAVRPRPSAPASTATTAPPLLVRGISVTWLGHACFQIVPVKGPRIVIDPFDSRVGAYPWSNPKADVVLVTHEHFDH